MMASYLSLNIYTKKIKQPFFFLKIFASPSVLLNSVRHEWTPEVFVDWVFPNTRACSVDIYGNRLCKNSQDVCTQRNIPSVLSYALFDHPKSSPSCKHFTLPLPSSQKENCFPFRRKRKSECCPSLCWLFLLQDVLIHRNSGVLGYPLPLLPPL